MAIENKIIDTEIIEGKPLQINFNGSNYTGLGDITNLYTITEGSLDNEDKIESDYYGISHGSGSMSFNYFGISDEGYNGNTYDHIWEVSVIDTAVDPGIEDYVIPDKDGGYSYANGNGDNSTDFNGINGFRSNKRLWQLDGPGDHSIGGSWSPCSSGLSDTNGGLVGWTTNNRRNGSCGLTADSSFNTNPDSFSWTLSNFPFIDSFDGLDSTLPDNINTDITDWSSDLYSYCDNGTCKGGYSGRQESACVTNDECIEGSYYVCLYMQSHDAEYVNETRDKTITIYRLPKRHIRNLWNISQGGSETIVWGSNGIYPKPNHIESDDGEKGAAAFAGGDLSITITSPDIHAPPMDETDWYYIQEESDYRHFTPENIVDYPGLNLYNTNDPFLPKDIFDYRPISYVSVNTDDDIVDLQSWYDIDTDESFIASAPNRIRLSFRISENIDNFQINYFNYDFSENQWRDNYNNILGDMNFKFFVIDWDAENDEIDSGESSWEDIISNLPQNYGEIEKNQTLYDTYRYIDLIDTVNQDYNYLEHEYSTAGVKIIKAVIFSYVKHSDDTLDGDGVSFNNYIQSLRWKIVSIRIFMGVNAVDVEDFSDLGGSDYTFIPWPYSTPIIGGMSDESNYFDSILDIYNANLFNDNELFDYYRTFIAYNNLPGNKIDELGDHLGEVDISQIRYFSNGTYDMNTLLNLSQDDIIDSGGNFNPYNDDQYWTGDSCVHYNNCSDEYNPTYPLDSCVGTIFINNNSMKNLRDDCIIELNMGDEEDGLIDDTTGYDNKGVIIGDYSVKKDDYGNPISRDESMDLPKIGTDDGAF